MKDFVVIYPTQNKADEALRRTAEVFGKESWERVDVIRRKIILRSGNTIRFISENRLCHKLHSLMSENTALLDCWRFDKQLEKHEKLKSMLVSGSDVANALKEGEGNVAC